MSFVKRITACMLLLASVFIVYPGSAKGFSYDEILAWVANELEVEGDYPLPEIFITSKNNLQEILIGKTKKSHMLWAKVYGEVEARKMMNKCLDEILGLFDPETKVIYVGDFMDSCKIIRWYFLIFFNYCFNILLNRFHHVFQKLVHGRAIGMAPL